MRDMTLAIGLLSACWDRGLASVPESVMVKIVAQGFDRQEVISAYAVSSKWAASRGMRPRVR